MHTVSAVCIGSLANHLGAVTSVLLLACLRLSGAIDVGAGQRQGQSQFMPLTT